MNPVDQAESVAADELAPETGIGRQLLGRRNVEALLRTQGLLLMLGVLVLVFSLSSPYFFTTSNALIIAGNMSVLGIMALAQTFLVVAGGIDLSVGSVVALTTVLIGIFAADMNPWLAAGLAMVAAIAIGVVNGVIVVRIRINALITTLATLSIFSGVAFILTGAESKLVPEGSFGFLGAGYIGDVPFSFVLYAGIFLVFVFVERLTVLGQRIHATGGQPEAARLVGLKVGRILFGLFVLSAASAGLAGIIVTSQLGSSAPQTGATYLLSVVTAVFLGGTSLAGGRGSVIGTFTAVLILAVLQNGFALLQLSSYYQDVALGVALLLAVILDTQARARLRVRV
jgi:ribose transport system permease protein